MHDPQPELPFGEPSALDEIRRLLETQNELLRTIADRLAPRSEPIWALQALAGEDDYDPFTKDLLPDYDDDDWDPFEDDDEVLPDPPEWFPRNIGL